MKLKKWLFASWLNAACLTLLGQQQIMGVVLDQEKSPLVGATAVLNKKGSKEILKAAFTDVNGAFTFENSRGGDTLVVVVTYVGYEEARYELAPTTQLTEPIELVLKSSSISLSEVKVTAQRAFAVQKIDRIVVTPDVLIGNAGGTALEILEKSPGVTVDMNGGINVRGKNGVVIFIDDRPSYLSAADLVSYLRSLPASSVETIEIMTNPPAKYDAAGNAGVINIKMKRNIAKGSTASYNGSIGKGKEIRYSNSVNVNYRRDKVNLFANGSINQNNTYQDLTISRYYFTSDGRPSSSFIQNSLINPKNGSRIGKIGVDYYATDKMTWGASWSGFYNPSERNVSNTATIADANKVATNYVEASTPTDILFKNASLNLNMTRKLKVKGSEITANYDRIGYESQIDQVLTNTLLSAGRQVQSKSVLLSFLPTDIGIQSAKIDYLRPTGKGRLELGAKTSFVNTENVADFFDVASSGSRTKNETFSNDFNYAENINAAYANLSADYRKMSIQAGLRIENTRFTGNQKGNSVVNDTSFKRSYFSPFPTLFLQYRLDSARTNVLAFNLGRRIDRPSYKDLNPFSYPIDRYTYYGGNPLLVPTYSYVCELSHTYKSYLTTSISYVRSSDVISETNEQRGTIYYSRPGNFDTQETYGISVNSMVKLRKWWTLQWSSSLLKNRFESKVYTEYLDDAKWYYTIGPVNQFTLNSKWSAEVAASYQSKVLSGQFLISPIGSVRAGLTTKMFKEKVTARMSVSDIFYTNQVEGTIRNIANAQAGWFSYLDTRVATLAMAYRFSKGQTLKVRQSGAAESEQKRVKV